MENRGMQGDKRTGATREKSRRREESGTSYHESDLFSQEKTQVTFEAGVARDVTSGDVGPPGLEPGTSRL